MNYSDPLNSLSVCMVQASIEHLNDIEYEDRKGKQKRKPSRQDFQEVILFQQTFSSTALCFGGIGGQAITSADVVVIIGPMGDVCIYVAGRIKVHINKPNELFYKELSGRHFDNWGKFEKNK